MTLSLLITKFFLQKVEEHMYSVRFRRIRVGLGSLFSCLLLLLGLFTLTGTASAYTLHTHAASTGSLVDASCSTGEIGAFTFYHLAGGRVHPHIVCHRYPPNPSCEGTIKVTFVHSHKNESPKLVCNPNKGDPYTMQFSPW